MLRSCGCKTGLNHHLSITVLGSWCEMFVLTSPVVFSRRGAGHYDQASPFLVSSVQGSILPAVFWFIQMYFSKPEMLFLESSGFLPTILPNKAYFLSLSLTVLS